MGKLNNDVDIHRTHHLKIDVVDEDGGTITSQSVQTQLLLAILEKLEEIKQEIKNSH